MPDNEQEKPAVEGEKKEEKAGGNYFEGKSAGEVQAVFTRLTDIAEAQERRLRELEQKNAELSSALSSNFQPPAPPKEPDPDDDKPLSDLMLENPEKALRKFIESNYGSRFSHIENTLGRTVLNDARNRFPRFTEFEEDILGELNKRGVAVSNDSLEAAYYMTLGRKNEEERRLAERERSNSDNSPPPTDDAGKGISQLTDLDRELMRKGNYKDEQEYIRFRDGDFKVKVPGHAKSK